ncbi:Batten's disease protein Cln3 [Trichoderma barbatum]
MPFSLFILARSMPHGHTQSTIAVARSQCRTVAAFWLFGFINAILYAAILSAALDLVGSNIPKGPYWMRIPAFALLSICGMFLIAFTGESTDWSSIIFKMTGIALASVSSGGGDLSFLALTNYYGHPGLAAWSSGTGALLQMDLDTRSDSATSEDMSSQPSVGGMEESDALLASPTNASSCHSLLPGESVEEHNSRTSRMRRIILPLMGVSPTLLYPLSSTPFKQYREFYPTYIALYQFGVFLGRSSTSFFRIYVLYLFSYLQCLNLILLFIHAIFNFIPSVYVIFLIIFWEGLLGGLAYVNTFAKLADEVPI